MTIDTSREAVERLSKAARNAEYRQFPHGVFADTFDALAAERDDYAAQLGEMVPALNREAVEQRARAEAAEAEVARLSTPPDDAEVAGLVMKARDGFCVKSNDGPFGSGWSVDLSATAELLNAMADALTRLSQAHAALRKALHVTTGDLIESREYALALEAELKARRKE